WSASRISLEDELRLLRSEQKNLVRALAAGGEEIPELVAAMKNRNERIRRLGHHLEAARRAPPMIAGALNRIEEAVRGKLADLADAIANDRARAREAFRSLFPDGLWLRPVQAGRRQVWEITGNPTLDGASLMSDPTRT